MKQFFLILSILFCVQLSAEETVIQGKFPGFDQKVLKVGYYDDYITNQKVFVAETQIKNGEYRLSLELKSSRQLILKVEDKENTFFAEAGKVYNLNLSYDEETNRGKAFDKSINLNFSFPQPTEMNQLIKKFNQDYSAFFQDNIKKFATNTAKEKVEQFVDEQSAVKAYQENEFVKNYVTYVLANLEDINKKPKDKLFEKYLKGKEILYTNKEYMNFFKQLYQKDFERLTLSKWGAEILKAISIDEDLNKTLKQIKESKGFERDELAELYLIYGLFDTYYRNTVNPKSNLKMLKMLSENASNAANKKIAANAIEALKRLDKDQMAPAFELKNENGMLVKLSDFKGKPIYLNFWADWSVPSLRQMSVMQKLHEKYGEDIHFISINLDENPDKMKEFIRLKNLNWTFLHYGNDFELREKYNVRTVPTYFLIDADGKFIQTNAPAPTEVEQKLFEIGKEKEIRD
ncbi:MAG: TlpA disulfide reductase family protein [Vicingaceae bacterium]